MDILHKERRTEDRITPIERHDLIWRKYCPKCKNYLPLCSFNLSLFSKSRIKRASYCKGCAEKYRNNYYNGNKNGLLAKERARRIGDPNYGRKKWLKKKYGITLEDYEKMYRDQYGRCAICSTFFLVLSVDHNHTTKKVRGLLCDYCNVGIGGLRDNVELLSKAIDYLKRTDS